MANVILIQDKDDLLEDQMPLLLEEDTRISEVNSQNLLLDEDEEG
jgi:hypothetical protein